MDRVRRQGQSKGSARLVATLAAALAVATGGAGFWLFSSDTESPGSGTGGPRYVVRRGDLKITLRQSGTFSAEEAEDVRANVRGSGKIEWLIEEGTVAKKGDRLVELDKEAVLKEIEALEAQVEKAQVNLVAAETDEEITRLECESRDLTAALDVALIELEIRKFKEGTKPKEERDADIRIEQAEAKYRRLKAADDRMREMKMFEQGFVTKEELEQSALDVRTAANELETAKLEKRILTTYTHDVTLRKLEGQLRQASAEMERFKQVTKRRKAQTQAATAQCRQELARAQEQLADAKLRLSQMTIRAETGGIVVYGSGVRGRWRQEENIKVGATVYNQQVLMRLPNLNTMEIIVRINEADINKIHITTNGSEMAKQPATITIDSMPGKTFEGYVKKVDTLAQSTWFNEYVKWFPTTIGLVKQIPGVRPGMSANVEILVDELKDVLLVPVQYVQTRSGRSYCIVLSEGEQARRQVVLGAGNNSFVEIKEGLKEGEVVLLPTSGTEAAHAAEKTEQSKAPEEPRRRRPR